MARMELSIDDLLLDPDNPRIGSADSQAEALEAIVRLDANHFRTMMRSIVDHGLDPGDSLYIIREAGEGEGYTVVDGNRRLAALKVLNEPAVLQGTGLGDTIVKRLAKVAEDFDAASADLVSCVLFDTRADADEWILRRHGRGMEGEARIPWGTLEIQRFQKDRTVLDVIDFVERNSTFSNDDWAQIRAEIEAKPSVLRRFLDSKKGRDWLGMSVKDEGGEKVPVLRFIATFPIATEQASQLTDVFRCPCRSRPIGVVIASKLNFGRRCWRHLLHHIGEHCLPLCDGAVVHDIAGADDKPLLRIDLVDKRLGELHHMTSF